MPFNESPLMLSLLMAIASVAAVAVAQTQIPPNVARNSATAHTTPGQVNSENMNGPLSPANCGARNPASWCTGSSPSDWINAAFAAVPDGGTVDFTGFGPGPLYLSGTVTVGTNKDVSIRCDPSTQFAPLTNSVTPLFSFGANVHLDGRCYINISNTAGNPSAPPGALSFAYTGTAVEIQGTTVFNQVPVDVSNLYIYAYGNSTATD